MLQRLALTAALALQAARALETYDVVVVGSGPGGLMAAEFLSRDENVSVLVLEAGGPSLQATGGTDVPSYAAAEGYTKFDIPGEYDASGSIFASENAKYKVDYIDDAQLYLGQLVGGCSSLNGALYFRTPDSYVDAASWPFPASKVTSLFDDMETQFGHTDQPSTDGKWYVQDAYEIVSDALTMHGGYSEQTLNDEDARNAKDKTFGHPPFAIKDGLRDSPAKTCWGVMMNRTNVKLLTSARVSYIKHEHGRATGVVYNDDVEVEVSANGAVIMAAGAIGTPKVLIQSSIGPRDQMAALKPINDQFPGILENASDWVVNPNVGKWLFDTTLVLPTFTNEDMESFQFGATPDTYVEQFLSNHSGPLAFPGPLLISYENYAVNGRMYEFQMTILTHGMDAYATADDGFTAALYINNPESRDFCSFNTDGKYRAFTNGSAYMSTDNDVAAMRNFTARVVDMLEAGGSTFVSAGDNQSVSDWVDSKRGTWTQHFGGSCYASGDATDPNRCADASLRVVGTSNIFVGDGSAMKVGTVNPYGFIMYIGRQVAELVQQQLEGQDLDEGEEEADRVRHHRHKLRVRIHS